MQVNYFFYKIYTVAFGILNSIASFYQLSKINQLLMCCLCVYYNRTDEPKTGHPLKITLAIDIIEEKRELHPLAFKLPAFLFAGIN